MHLQLGQLLPHRIEIAALDPEVNREAVPCTKTSVAPHNTAEAMYSGLAFVQSLGCSRAVLQCQGNGISVSALEAVTREAGNSNP